MIPDNLAAQGLPVETGSHLPVALCFIGAVIEEERGQARTGVDQR